METKKTVLAGITNTIFQKAIVLIVLFSLSFFSFGQQFKKTKLFSFQNDCVDELTSFQCEQNDKEELVVVCDRMGEESFSKVIIIKNARKRIYVLDISGKLKPGVYKLVATSMKMKMKEISYKQVVVRTF